MSKRYTPAQSAAAKRAAFANQRHLLATSQKRYYGIPKAEKTYLESVYESPRFSPQLSRHDGFLPWPSYTDFYYPLGWYQVFCAVMRL